jgi:hypothetical protein
MNDGVRLAATAIIWLALAGILISAGIVGGDMVALALILGIGATVSTGIIWDSSRPNARGEMEEASKSKRNHRLTRLVDKLDEDEVYQLEDLLAARHDDQTRD